jgi:hypothetical protein
LMDLKTWKKKQYTIFDWLNNFDWFENMEKEAIYNIIST